MTIAPFTIDTQSTMIAADPAPWRARFDADRALLFEQPFAPALLASLLERAAQTPYQAEVISGVGRRAAEQPPRVGRALMLLLSRPPLLDWLAEATGLAPLGHIAGSLVETRAAAGQSLGWHDDMDTPGRQLGLVVNLSTDQYDGGLFEQRRRGEDAPFRSIRYDQPGSITVFAVNRALEHRVTPVTTGGPRRVFAGWVMATPAPPMRPA